MIVIDLKTYPFLCQFSGKTLEGGTHVYRTTSFLPDNGLYAVANFSLLCSQISWRLQYKKVLLSRSIFLHGLCPTHLSGKSSRYRSVSSVSK